MSGKVKRKTKQYEDRHKEIEEIIYKLCSDCNEWLAMDNEFYKNKKGHNPYCKKCTIKRSTKWRNKNKLISKDNQRQWYQLNKEHLLEKQKVINKNNLETRRINEAIWRKENKDKIKLYQINRNIHKSHKISNNDIKELYEYANGSCMYCGITEEEHKKLHNQRLHRDHAINEGSNGIDNCILACRSCNSEKHNKDWNYWYTSNNPKYTEERYIKINGWLDKF